MKGERIKGKRVYGGSGGVRSWVFTVLSETLSESYLEAAGGRPSRWEDDARQRHHQPLKAEMSSEAGMSRGHRVPRPSGPTVSFV